MQHANANSIEPPGARREHAERPRERFYRYGARALEDVELIALILRTGDPGCDAIEIARRVLHRVGDWTRLSDEDATTLLAIKGMGRAKAASLVAAFELGRRAASVSLEPGQRIQSPADVRRHFIGRLREWRRESFHVLLLDGRHRLINVEAVSVGTLTASLVHPREVFRSAIRRAAAALLLVHNHPSGDPNPSSEDRMVTRRLSAAGELIGIRIVDHVIVAERGYYSFRERESEFAALFEDSKPDPANPRGSILD